MIKIEWWCKKKNLSWFPAKSLFWELKDGSGAIHRSRLANLKAAVTKSGLQQQAATFFNYFNHSSVLQWTPPERSCLLREEEEEEEQDRSEIIFRKHKIILAFWEVPVYFKQSIESRESHEGTVIQPLSQSLSISVAPSGLWLCSSHWDDSIQRSVCVCVSVFYFYVAPEIKNTRNIILLLCYCVFSAFI